MHQPTLVYTIILTVIFSIILWVNYGVYLFVFEIWTFREPTDLEIS